jgi:hypothetical protein
MAAAERRTGFVFRALWSPGGVRVWRLEADREELEKRMKAARKARLEERAAFGDRGRWGTKWHPEAKQTSHI